jgi:hypothetical protein
MVSRVRFTAAALRKLGRVCSYFRKDFRAAIIPPHVFFEKTSKKATQRRNAPFVARFLAFRTFRFVQRTDLIRGREGRGFSCCICGDLIV